MLIEVYAIPVDKVLSFSANHFTDKVETQPDIKTPANIIKYC